MKNKKSIKKYLDYLDNLEDYQKGRISKESFKNRCIQNIFENENEIRYFYVSAKTVDEEKIKFYNGAIKASSKSELINIFNNEKNMIILFYDELTEEEYENI